MAAGPVAEGSHRGNPTMIMSEPLAGAHAVTKLPAQDLERARAFYRDKLGLEPVEERSGGLRYLCNHPPGTTDLPPVRVGVSIGDSLAGLYAAFGIAAACWQRDRPGCDRNGRTLDVALTESVLSMMEVMLPEYGVFGSVRPSRPTFGRLVVLWP